jgi:hypothetical protein
MGWAEARAQLVSIVKGTIPTVRLAGAGERFRYVDFAHLSETRNFAIRLGGAIAGSGPLMPSTQTLRRKLSPEIAVFYRPHDSDRVLDEVIWSDVVAVGASLMDDSLWNRPASTIDMIEAGDHTELMRTDIERFDDGSAMVIFSPLMEIRG